MVGNSNAATAVDGAESIAATGRSIRGKALHGNKDTMCSLWSFALRNSEIHTAYF